MDETPLSEWFSTLYEQSATTIAMVLDMLRKDGEEISTYVMVVADMRDEATRFFVDQLGDGPSDPAMPGFVGAIPCETIARVLTLIGADAFAAQTDEPIEDGRMRVLVAAKGQLQCADIPISPPLSPGGSA